MIIYRIHYPNKKPDCQVFSKLEINTQAPPQQIGVNRAADASSNKKRRSLREERRDRRWALGMRMFYEEYEMKPKSQTIVIGYAKFEGLMRGLNKTSSYSWVTEGFSALCHSSTSLASLPYCLDAHSSFPNSCISQSQGSRYM